MSKQIDWSKPVSEEDKAWAAQFSIHHPLIQMNEEQFGSGDASEGGSLAGDEVPPYDQWKVEDLKAEADRRELSYNSKATKADLVSLLEADDAAEEQSPA